MDRAKKMNEWSRMGDRHELSVGRYDLVVFGSMFPGPNDPDAPTIYTNHSGKRLIVESLSGKYLKGVKTIRQAKQAIIARFKEIISQEMADFQQFLKDNPEED